MEHEKKIKLDEKKKKKGLKWAEEEGTKEKTESERDSSGCHILYEL